MSHIDRFEDKQSSLDRIIFFSDGVFAIAITLLAFQIRLPDNTSLDQLPTQVWNLRFQALSYIISFAVVGLYWMVHHRMARYLRRYDGLLIWLNLGLLMSIAFLPFPSSILGVYSKDGFTFFPVVFYAACMSIVGVLILAIYVHANYKHRLVDKDLPNDYLRLGLLRTVVPPAVFLLSIAVSLLSPVAGIATWLLIPVARLLISRIFRHLP